MLNDPLFVQSTFLVQPSDDVFVCIFYIFTGKVANFFCESTIHTHWTHECFYIVLTQNPIVVFTKSRCLMHQAGTLIGSNIVIS